jgi:hypothetical protein
MMDRLSEFRLWGTQYSTYVYVWLKSDKAGVIGNGDSRYDVLKRENFPVYEGYVGDEVEWRGLECNGTNYTRQKSTVGSGFEYRGTKYSGSIELYLS